MLPLFLTHSAQAWWDYQTPDHASWWLKGDTPGSTAKKGVIDWRVPAAADYYVNEVIGEHTAKDSNIDGIFVDSGFFVAASANLTCVRTLASHRACRKAVRVRVRVRVRSNPCHRARPLWQQ